MAGLLDALLMNESGGRNIANTTEGTSSGQAQGYFQITTGTWDEFGGRQFAPDPLHATYEQQAAIASKIPLRRWDETTVQRMSATGKPIDVNRTLGENLAANGEGFQGTMRVSGPVEAAGGGAGADVGAPTLYSPPVASAFAGLSVPATSEDMAAAPYVQRRTLGDDLAASVSDTADRRQSSGGGNGVTYGAADQEPASSSAFDFGSQAVPEDDGQAPSALVPPDQSLADLFTVRNIGQAAFADPRTGASLLGRKRRAYG